jgi:sortase (surface protein transpeptidase)
MGNTILESDYSQSYEIMDKKKDKKKKKKKKKKKDSDDSSSSGGSSEDSDSIIDQVEIPDDLKLPDIKTYKRYEKPFIP